ncbi:MAG: hypothetical protein RL392_2449 [Pseudomonadota bacterium]|jgi:hypothetical protein
MFEFLVLACAALLVALAIAKLNDSFRVGEQNNSKSALSPNRQIVLPQSANISYKIHSCLRSMDKGFSRTLSNFLLSAKMEIPAV